MLDTLRTTAPTAQLTAFRPSPTNPRKRFTAQAIVDLADSIAAHGLLQPVLARPWPGAKPGDVPWEIVAGERRWRACTLLAEQGRHPDGDIAYMVRELSDAAVLAIQLHENIQREDLHPLEEAEHYQRMRADPGQPATVERIAHEAGVSIQRVYDRLALLRLVDKAREAFMADRINAKLALQVARMPAPIQAELVEHLANWGGEPMGPKAAAKFIADRYMLRLAGAPFDPEDADLPGGSCGTCLKRTGANPSLFGDVGDADTCTDTGCFAARKVASRERDVAEWRDAGLTVLQGDEAKAACTSDGRHLAGGWFALEAQVPTNLGDPKFTVAEVLEKGHAPSTATCLIDHPAGTPLLRAVELPVLERWLRKIKRHRDQLDRAAAEKAGRSAPQPAAEDERDGEAIEPQHGTRPDNAEPGEQISGKTADGETLACPEGDVPAGPSDDLVAELLTFTPPPTAAGMYRGMTLAAYQREQEARALSILVAAEVVRSDRRAVNSPALPSLFLLAPMLNRSLIQGAELAISFSDVARLLGVASPETLGVRAEHWPAELPPSTQHLLVVLLLVLQESNGDDGFEHFARDVAELMGIDVVPLISTAHASVKQTLQLGAIQHGAEAKGGKKVPVKYRCPMTGNSWSGRGLQPKWLKVALEGGAKLSDFEVKS